MKRLRSIFAALALRVARRPGQRQPEKPNVLRVKVPASRYKLRAAVDSLGPVLIIAALMAGCAPAPAPTAAARRPLIYNPSTDHGAP